MVTFYIKYTINMDIIELYCIMFYCRIKRTLQFKMLTAISPTFFRQCEIDRKFFISENEQINPIKS